MAANFVLISSLNESVFPYRTGPVSSLLPNERRVATSKKEKERNETETYTCPFSSVQFHSCLSVTCHVVWLNWIHVGGVSGGFTTSIPESHRCHVLLSPSALMARSVPAGEQRMAKSMGDMYRFTKAVPDGGDGMQNGQGRRDKSK